MKLQNIILALCAAVAFSACTKDDSPYANAKARLTVKVVTSGTPTKADPNELEGEANINTLTAFVFDPADGSLQGMLGVAPKVSHEYTFSGIPSNMLGVVHLVIITNAPSSITAATSYQELEAMTAELSAQSQDNLMMSSQRITTQALVEGENLISGTIILTRLPARIQVGSVTTRFTKPLLVGRRVLINNVYVENAKERSRYFSVADWGEVQLRGNFKNTSKVLYTDYTPVTKLGYGAYVMENLGTETQKTAIIVDATLEQNGSLTPIRKTFRSVINANGKLRGADHNYVKRNYVYNVGITFTDSSFDPTVDPPIPDPDPVVGMLDVQVEVIPYGPVTQNPDF